MILPESYTRDWIEGKRKAYPKSDPNIMEKVIYALSLVEQLVGTGLSFVFKGGTSLLLILPEPKRFSIDIDIVTASGREEVEAALTTICAQGVFSKWELDEPRSYRPGIPKAHYLLTFFSQWDQRERIILLDVLYEDHGYPALTQARVENEWIRTDRDPVRVWIPTPESITGDKLTAFAPNTTGIRFRVVLQEGRVVEKQMEVMKQLFDLGILFDQVTDPAHCIQSFDRIARKEIAYRDIVGIEPAQVLDDIVDTSLMIASLGKVDPNGHFPYVNEGLTRLKSYIYNGAFRIDEAVLASSKAAYLAAVIRTGHEGGIQRWREGEDIRNYFVKPVEYQFLNKRRNIPGAPLFYWYHTLTLLGKV